MPTPSYAFAPPTTPSLPIIGRPARFPINRIFCVGRNYHAHAVEMGRPVDKATMQPFYFTKSPSALVESGATVPYPAGTANYHYEMELVVAIGDHGFRLAEADAQRMVFGYAAGLDMTRRDLQLVARDQGRPWDLGKDFEKSAVCSPILPIGKLGVLTDGAIRLQVNGETRQSADLAQLIWNIPELLADLSRFYHLEPGDLIYTGTPEGVGPVKFGDCITGHIDRVGEVALTVGPPEQAHEKSATELARIRKFPQGRTALASAVRRRRMLDPKHGTKVPALERALHALGKRVELVVS